MEAWRTARGWDHTTFQSSLGQLGERALYGIEPRGRYLAWAVEPERSSGGLPLAAWQALCDLHASEGRGVFVTFSEHHLKGKRKNIDTIEVAPIEHMVSILMQLRDAGGQLIFLSIGGSAGNCGHKVNDFRKIVGIKTNAPTDSVSELTAPTNDEGWEQSLLNGSRLAASRPPRSSSSQMAAAAWKKIRMA
ncbi:MAG: hypothetical protein JOZ11_02880 [Alphaproteobacteria bacterium]|nr:hypothetical protein [Alphaproteobacteria bacterium]